MNHDHHHPTRRSERGKMILPPHQPDTDHLEELLLNIFQEESRQEQIDDWDNGERGPLYQFNREPIYIDELWGICSKAAIWRNNGTILYISTTTKMDRMHSGHIAKRLHLTLETYPHRQMITITIVGTQDIAIAETAVFLWQLKHRPTTTEDSKSILKIRKSDDSDFDFRIVTPEQLSLCFEANSQRKIELNGITLTTEQSQIIASRPHPIHLVVSFGTHFEDHGQAFVNTILHRQTNFGELGLDSTKCFSIDCLKRLLQQGKTIERLKLGDELNQQSLTASVQALACTLVFSSDISIDFSSLSALSLHLIARSRDQKDPTGFLLSLFQRMIELQECQALTLYLYGVPTDFQIPNHVGQELIRAIHANRNLTTLQLEKGYLDWSPFATKITSAMELNKFYRHIKTLMVEPPSIRSTLVAKCCIMDHTTSDNDTTTNNHNAYSRFSILLANHVDVLCELLLQGSEEFL